MQQTHQKLGEARKISEFRRTELMNTAKSLMSKIETGAEYLRNLKTERF